MPAEAGIQAVRENNNFKYLDSRFRGNDDIFPVATQSLEGEGLGGGDIDPNQRHNAYPPTSFPIILPN